MKKLSLIRIVAFFLYIFVFSTNSWPNIQEIVNAPQGRQIHNSVNSYHYRIALQVNVAWNMDAADIQRPTMNFNILVSPMHNNNINALDVYTATMALPPPVNFSSRNLTYTFAGDNLPYHRNSVGNVITNRHASRIRRALHWDIDYVYNVATGVNTITMNRP